MTLQSPGGEVQELRLFKTLQVTAVGSQGWELGVQGVQVSLG